MHLSSRFNPYYKNVKEFPQFSKVSFNKYILWEINIFSQSYFIYETSSELLKNCL